MNKETKSLLENELSTEELKIVENFINSLQTLFEHANGLHNLNGGFAEVTFDDIVGEDYEFHVDFGIATENKQQSTLAKINKNILIDPNKTHLEKTNAIHYYD
jgi:hypothetical protein